MPSATRYYKQSYTIPRPPPLAPLRQPSTPSSSASLLCPTQRGPVLPFTPGQNRPLCVLLRYLFLLAITTSTTNICCFVRIRRDPYRATGGFVVYMKKRVVLRGDYTIGLIISKSLSSVHETVTNETQKKGGEVLHKKKNAP